MTPIALSEPERSDGASKGGHGSRPESGLRRGLATLGLAQANRIVIAILLLAFGLRPTSGLRRGLARGALIVILLVAGEAGAHALGPASLQIEEQAPGRATARFQKAEAAALAPRWADGCTAMPIERHVRGADSIERFELRCAQPLAGSVLGVDGLAERDTIAIVRVRLADGHVARAILGPSRPRFTVPTATPWHHTLGQHVRLGIEHLLGGLDHVLFVLGLLLVVPGLRARALTLTAFTAGHSVTLALAALDIVRVPAAPVEVLIALTLLVVAVQALDRQRPARHAWPLAAGFGLIHGLGFAGALTSAGLPAGDLPLALAGFNLGIELGQLALAAAIIGLTALATTAAPFARRAAPLARLTTAYAIGALAVMWCLERASW